MLAYSTYLEKRVTNRFLLLVVKFPEFILFLRNN